MQSVQFAKLHLDGRNPHHKPTGDEPSIISHLVLNAQIFPSAQDICNRGLSPLERLAATPHPTPNGHYVMVARSLPLCAFRQRRRLKIGTSKMPTTYIDLGLKDWATIIAALLGPILAVQAQKAVEAFRERRHRKISLFEQLMATRASRLAPEHVRALNMIDLIFYEGRIEGLLRRSSKENLVLGAWKEYHDHLSTKPEENLSLWGAQGDDFFTNLLFAISQDLGFSFDRVQLRRGAYSPMAHGEIEAEQNELRKATLSLVTGKHALNMNVVSLPVDQEVLEANKVAIQNLGKALETGALHVAIKATE